MNLLAFDTSTTAGSIALARDGRVLSEWNLDAGGRNAERLLPGIDFLLRSAGIRADSLEALATTCGPGSFTGLRIGIATAKSLALVLGLPLHGVSTLEAIAFSMRETGLAVVAAVDAHRGGVFAQGFLPANGGARPDPLPGPLACPEEHDPESLASVCPPGALVAGDGLQRFREVFERLSPPGTRLSAGPWFLAAPAAILASNAHARGERPHPGSLEAQYLRPADATKGQGTFNPICPR